MSTINLQNQVKSTFPCPTLPLSCDGERTVYVLQTRKQFATGHSTLNL